MRSLQQPEEHELKEKTPEESLNPAVQRGDEVGEVQELLPKAPRLWKGPDRIFAEEHLRETPKSRQVWERAQKLASLALSFFLGVVTSIAIPSAWKGTPQVANNDADEQRRSPQAEAQRPNDEARHWQEAYERVTRGDEHPDRHLDGEDRRKLREALEAISKEPGNKEYIKLDIGISPNVEAQKLGFQLYQILRDAHWNVSRPRTDFPDGVWEEMQSDGGASYVSGVYVFTDDTDKGQNLSLILNDCCQLGVIVNPKGKPESFKGTMLWVGNKQFTQYKDDE